MTTEGWAIIYFSAEGHNGTNKQTKNAGGIKEGNETETQPDFKACECVYLDPLLKGLPLELQVRPLALLLSVEITTRQSMKRVLVLQQTA